MFWLKNWPFFKLRKKLVSWADKGVYPADNKMPQAIKISRSIGKTIKQMKDNTNADGSERAVTVLDIDGLLILTPAISGESEKVVLKHKFEVKYQYDRKNQRCYRQIYRDDRLIIKDYFMAQKAPLGIKLRVLFNIHTHPHPEISNFFSEVDIEGFLSNPKIPALVLVTKDIWCLLKTRKTQEPRNQILSQNPLKQCQEAGLAVYKGRIGERLKRIG